MKLTYNDRLVYVRVVLNSKRKKKAVYGYYEDGKKEDLAPKELEDINYRFKGKLNEN